MPMDRATGHATEGKLETRQHIKILTRHEKGKRYDMKNFKKILALIIACMMTISMATIAHADSEYKITVENTNTNISINGKTYTAYRLFDAVYGTDGAAYTINKTKYDGFSAALKGVLTTYFDFTAVAGDTSNYAVTVNDTKKDASTGTLSDADVRALADALQPYLASFDVAGSAAAASEKAVIDVGTAGYYIVDGTADASDGATGKKEIVAALALTNANKTADIQPKADGPHVDKNILKANGQTFEKVKLDDVNVGDKVDYQLDSVVPDMTGYASYTFKAVDKMSKGLTFNNDVAVKIDGQTYTDFTATPTTDATSGETTITITFNNFIDQKANKGKAITITYSATVNENAVVTGHEENTVKLQFSHNPYDEKLGTPDEVLGETVESKTDVYSTNLELIKKDTSGNLLTGAKFKIEGISSNVKILNGEAFNVKADGGWYRLKNGTYTQTAPTDATADQYDGTTQYEKIVTIDKTSAAVTTYTNEGWVTNTSALAFNGLGEGTYTITELVAPKGYNLLTSPITVVVSFDKTNKVFKATVNGGSEITASNNKISFDVENNKGVQLPSTGGIGTTIFYILGGILILGAAIALIGKKKFAR